MKNNAQEALVADAPLIDPKDDRLEFAGFANNLSNAISKIETDECLVFALFGLWGSGKTSCLNFVRYYINQLPEEKKPIVVEFNPWWFSGSRELIGQFLREFSIALGKKGEFKNVIKFVGEFFEAVSAIPGSKTAAWLLKQASKDKSIIKIKSKIQKVLEKSNKRFLIIIDDIDRLASEEIRHLFSVIKAIADFPRTAYLLAFDKKVVIKALNRLQEEMGEEYLEKIVQVPFDLPIPNKSRLNKLFIERLNVIFFDSDAELIDQTYWGNVFLGGVEYYIDTVRNIKRFTNALKVSYPAVRGEVNPIDFIAIETLRIFRSEIYDLIRGNPDMFAGCTESSFNSSKRIEKIKPFHDKWLENILEEEKEVLKSLLMRIFPKLEAVFKNQFYGTDYLSTWRKKLRICSPEIFPIFFQLALPEGQISSIEMKSILSLAGNKEAFEENLIQLSQQIKSDGSTRVSDVLERLQDFTEKDISIEQIPSILQALFNIGDKLLIEADKGKGLFGIGNDIFIGQVMFQLLRRYGSQEERYKVLKETISKGEAAEIIVHEVEIYGQQQGKYGSQKRPETEWLINSEQLSELEKIALEKIKDSASKGELLRKLRAVQMLFRWSDWENIEAVKKYIAGIIISDEGLADFISPFLSQSSSWGMDDKVPRYQWRLDPKSMAPFVGDLSKIAIRCKKILEERPDWLKENNKIAFETFMRSYDSLSKGQDINNDDEE